MRTVRVLGSEMKARLEDHRDRATTVRASGVYEDPVADAPPSSVLGSACGVSTDSPAVFLRLVLALLLPVCEPTMNHQSRPRDRYPASNVTAYADSPAKPVSECGIWNSPKPTRTGRRPNAFRGQTGSAQVDQNRIVGNVSRATGCSSAMNVAVTAATSYQK